MTGSDRNWKWWWQISTEPSKVELSEHLCLYQRKTITWKKKIVEILAFKVFWRYDPTISVWVKYGLYLCSVRLWCHEQATSGLLSHGTLFRTDQRRVIKVVSEVVEAFLSYGFYGFGPSALLHLPCYITDSHYTSPAALQLPCGAREVPKHGTEGKRLHSSGK